MTTVKLTFDQKIDNIQDQLDTMRREDSYFRSYVNRKFDDIIGAMTTKDDLRDLESRVATKVDLNKLTAIVIKIAEKVGVST